MSWPFFKCQYEIGICSASTATHVPGIDEMSSLCFKDGYSACSIFRDHLTKIDLPPNGGDGSHVDHYLAVRG